MKKVIINGENLTISQVEPVIRERVKVGLDKNVKERINSTQKTIKKAIDNKKVIYGVTTGFGALSGAFISKG